MFLSNYLFCFRFATPGALPVTQHYQYHNNDNYQIDLQPLSKSIYMDQPTINAWKVPSRKFAGKFFHSVSWSIDKKDLTCLRHMGALVYHYRTYFFHQRHLLVPSIVKYWRGYQAYLLEKLAGKEMVIAGDGRHDSMGHSAKYGTYTIFCCTIGYIIHIVLVQVSKKLYLTQTGKPP